MAVLIKQKKNKIKNTDILNKGVFLVEKKNIIYRTTNAENYFLYIIIKKYGKLSGRQLKKK